MNIKLVFKVSVLIFALVMVIFAMKYFSSSVFQGSLDQVFNIPGKPFHWCSANQSENKKFKWLAQQAIQKTIHLSSAQLAQKYCTLQMEDFHGIDLRKAKWEKLAEAFDSEGQIQYLEWDKILQLFRASGLPFKSSLLYQDLTN